MGGFQRKTLQRIRRRTNRLRKHFETSLRAFDRIDLFSGPSQYFHLRTIACLRRHRSVIDALNNERYFDFLYATLTAWGLHRMGRGNTKLREPQAIRHSLLRNADRIRELETLRLSDFGVASVDRVTEDVWMVLKDLEVTKAKAFLVANSKALHHVLPSLVPPIDREYTLSFFFGGTSIAGREEVAFRAMYPHFHELARSRQTAVRRWIRRKGWNTSESKVIDNAIVGSWYSWLTTT